jgi:hypothetical protein
LTSEAGADDDALPEGAADVVVLPPSLLPHAARASAPANSVAAIFKPLYKGGLLLPDAQATLPGDASPTLVVRGTPTRTVPWVPDPSET